MGEESRLRAVVEMARAMAGEQGTRAVARAAADGARRALAGSFGALSVWERERGRLRVLVNAGELAGGEERYPADESYPVHDFPEVAGLSKGPAAWVETVAAGQPGGAARGRVAALRRRGRGSCVVAPVALGTRVWGELYVARGAHEPAFTPADAEFGAALAAVVAAGVAQLERLEEVRRLAFTDPLTGLANRRAVDGRLDEAVAEHLRSGTVASLVVCDLNGLKRVNDTLGHVVGDHLLERFGSVLSLCGARIPGALAARLGGDEFCLVASGVPASEVVAVAREVCRRAAALELGEGVSCGVASTGEEIGTAVSARRLLRLADAAQYRAKAAGAREPVVAGRGEAGEQALRLADTATGPGAERRAFRGREGPT